MNADDASVTHYHEESRELGRSINEDIRKEFGPEEVPSHGLEIAFGLFTFPTEGCFSDVTRLRDASATSYPTNATRRNYFSTFFPFRFYRNYKHHKKTFSSICFPPEGNFDIDARDGGGWWWWWWWWWRWGTIQDPIITKNRKEIFRTKIVDTSGTFSQKCIKISLEYIHIYRKSHRIR